MMSRWMKREGFLRFSQINVFLVVFFFLFRFPPSNEELLSKFM